MSSESLLSPLVKSFAVGLEYHLSITNPHKQPPLPPNNEPSAKLADNPVHDWDIFIPHVIHHHLAHARFGKQISVPEQKQVSSLEGRLHAAGEDDDDRRGGIADDGETFPHLLFILLAGLLGELVGRERTIKAVDSIRPKFMSWAAACRGFPKADNMSAVYGERLVCVVQPAGDVRCCGLGRAVLNSRSSNG